jgi:hypothetical protein
MCMCFIFFLNEPKNFFNNNYNLKIKNSQLIIYNLSKMLKRSGKKLEIKYTRKKKNLQAKGKIKIIFFNV